MKNLAGVSNDEIILEELYIANIPAVKVQKIEKVITPHTYFGKIGKWNFHRTFNYWIVCLDENEIGLPLKYALELYHKKHPIKDEILGNIIRTGGDCGSLSPDSYVSQPIYNDELNDKLEAIGYKKTYKEFLDESYISVSYGEIAELCNSGKLDVERYVYCYHIDEQIGLIEFVKFINDNNLK